MTSRGAPRTLQEVVTSGLCTGCGLCASLAGGEAIRMGLNSSGHSRPAFLGALPVATEQRILAACPGATLTGAGRPAGALTTAAWGPVRALHRSWAGDEAVRHRAAAGGTLTALGRFLLETGEVEAVVHVRASTTTPWLTDALVSTDPETVLRGSQSRYGPAAPLVHIEQLLDDGLRFAVIAKPCDISAVRSLARVDPRVDRQVPYMLTIFCGGVHNEKVPLQIIHHHGVPEDEVRVFRYRGNGWPGPTRVETTGGTRHDLTYEQAWHSSGQSWRYDLQFRCKICPDAVGESADLSAPDGWVLRDGKPIYEEAPGTNALLVRTARGADLVRRAVAAGALVLSPLSAAELRQMHPNHLDRRLGAPVQQLALQVTGSRRIALRRYRPLAALRAAGPRLLWQQFAGTLRRIRRRDNVEEPVDPASLPERTGTER